MSKKKNYLFDKCGDKCKVCGYNNCSRALEFHHIKETEYTINRRSGGGGGVENMTWPDIRKDYPYMITMCSNCHKEVHAGLHPEIPVPEERWKDYTGRPPYGYLWEGKREKRKLVKKKEEYENLQFILAEIKSGTSYGKLSNRLDKLGIKPQRAKKWHPMTIWNIIKKWE